MINLDKPDTLGFKKELEELIFPLAFSALFLAALCVAGVIISYIPTVWITAGVAWLFVALLIGITGYGLITDFRKLLAKRELELGGSISFACNVRCLLGWIKKTVTATVDSYPGSMP
jgi:peptidoglycan/LPS O-acetylase OafA/YrhL